MTDYIRDMPTKLTLFPDTNLFIQCRALASLPWAELGDWDEVELLVTRPVQAEIDRQKGGGNGRLARRAREASALIREAITSPGLSMILSQGRPRVILTVRPDLKAVTHDERLDIAVADDQLVAIGLGLSATTTVSLLTHDTGPLASATMVGLDCKVIPDSWLLPPEETKAEKDLKAATQELTRLRRSEPVLECGFVDGNDNPIEQLELQHVTYAPLTSGEIVALRAEIFERFPKEGSRPFVVTSKPQMPPGPIDIAELGKYVDSSPPISERDVAEYEKAYGDWDVMLEAALEKAHQRLAGDANGHTAIFRMRNIGTRPAENLLLEITAHGDIDIFRPQTSRIEPFELPKPPRPPKPRKPSFTDLINRQRYPGPRLTDLRMPYVPKPHDSEAFYYRPDTAGTVSLNCDLYRHGREWETFYCRLVVGKVGDFDAKVVAEVHAGNLSDRTLISLPVRVSTVQRPTLERVRLLISDMTFRADKK